MNTCRAISLALYLMWPFAYAMVHAEDQTPRGIDLLRDAQFRNGFRICASTTGRKDVTGQIQPRSASGEPAWTLCQWHSKFDLSDATPVADDGETLRVANVAKALTLSDRPRHRDLTLSLDSRPEYSGMVRKEGQPWPHLLIEQDDVPIYLLKDIDRVAFTIEARLLKNACTKLEGYSYWHHTAQFQLTFIVQDRSHASPGYGDFIWFNVPLYDERTEFCELYAAMDTADPSAKMIYAPPSRTFARQTLHGGKWATFAHGNLEPIFVKAIKLACDRGYLEKSPNPGDFAISSVIVGWEVTGINDVSMQIRNLGIFIHPDDS